MHFTFEAILEKDGWVAGCCVESPPGVIVTEAKTKEGLEECVKNAIQTFLSSSEGFTFSIIYKD